MSFNSSYSNWGRWYFLKICICLTDKVLEFYTFTFYYIYLFREEAHIMACIWKLGDNLLELVFFFYHVDYKDQTQVIRFGDKCH